MEDTVNNGQNASMVSFIGQTEHNGELITFIHTKLQQTVTIGRIQYFTCLSQEHKQVIDTSAELLNVTLWKTEPLRGDSLLIFQTCYTDHISVKSELIVKLLDEFKGRHTLFLYENIVKIPFSRRLFFQDFFYDEVLYSVFK